MHAQKVWNEFNCKTFREHHDLYMGLDVLQLADVFENFRDVCQKNCKLDPAWYYTASGLAWDALLKKTGVKLELLTDPNMLLFFEAGTRGGISICSNRYGKGNNPYMKGSYNPKEANKYLGYFDANNSYGYAMSQPQPTSGFKWMTTRQLKEWEKLPCVLEVDLEYPKVYMTYIMIIH